MTIKEEHMIEKILTISIAAYNVEKYIETTLKSLICKHMDKIEVIIENDGSTDRTAQLSQSFVEKYPETFILVNKANGGYGSTINKSLEIAKGKYFKQLDGDDWYQNENLDSFVELLEKIDTECVYTPYFEVYEGPDRVELCGLDEHLEGELDIDDVIEHGRFLQMHGLTFKTEFLRNINLRIEEHCFYTDQEFIFYPLMKTKRVYVSKLPIYMYRLGLEGQSVSMEGYLKHCDEHGKIVLNLLSKLSEIDKCSEKTKKRLYSHLQILIRIHYDINMYAGNRKKELIEFNNILKNKYPDIHNIFYKNNGKIFQILILTDFKLYNLAVWYKKRK